MIIYIFREWIDVYIFIFILYYILKENIYIYIYIFNTKIIFYNYENI